MVALVYDLAYLEWSLMSEREWFTLGNFRTALACFAGHSAFADGAALERYDRKMICGEDCTPEKEAAHAEDTCGGQQGE